LKSKNFDNVDEDIKDSNNNLKIKVRKRKGKKIYQKTNFKNNK